MLAACAVPFDFAEWEVTDQDAYLWRTPEVVADAKALVRFVLQAAASARKGVTRDRVTPSKRSRTRGVRQPS